jgi:hypothetical protein
LSAARCIAPSSAGASSSVSNRARLPPVGEVRRISASPARFSKARPKNRAARWRSSYPRTFSSRSGPARAWRLRPGRSPPNSCCAVRAMSSKRFSRAAARSTCRPMRRSCCRRPAPTSPRQRRCSPPKRGCFAPRSGGSLHMPLRVSTLPVGGRCCSRRCAARPAITAAPAAACSATQPRARRRNGGRSTTPKGCCSTPILPFRRTRPRLAGAIFCDRL